jgi:signal transduction histidine kinase/CheY-like chemotaxis protein/HPt (histidine-containing phosphotransfer) domain-containing protein
MRASCVECHNTHEDSPKRDWKEGDVRGVLEVALPMDRAAAAAAAGFRRSAALLAGFGAVALVGLGLVIVRLRRGAQQLENRVVERTRQLSLSNEALAIAREEALAASRAKGDFLANMSHEIRTPMNAILGMTDLVLDTRLNPSQREYLEMVQDAGDSLLTLINDILDFSKIEAGKLEFEQAVFSLRECVGDAMKTLAFRAHNKGLELAYRVDPAAPDPLIGDRTRLRQIINNLAGNAIKFTERGEVVLDVACDSRNDGEAVLHFTVSDTGIGIPQEKLSTIFEAFTQVDAGTTRCFGGTGLGLTISSRLAQIMGGRVWAESELGKGSKFHVTARFPLASEETTALPRAPANFVVQDTPVLIVDDNETNRLILREMLQSWGMLPVTAAGAAEALAKLRRAAEEGRPFRIVLTDVNMPEIDGFALLKQIRDDSALPGVVTILLTSSSRPGDAARSETTGASAFLMKPVKQSELFDAIGEALGIETHGEPASATAAIRLPPLNVLLAEDSRVNQRLAVGLLAKHGHEVTVANNGKEAVAAFENDRFDVVLMDVQMPEMDGIEATAVLRAIERQSGRRTPVIAMTAYAMKGDREMCLEAGMDDYVSKPVRAQQLFEAIERVLNRAAKKEIAAGPSTADGDGDVINWSEAVANAGEDRELLKDMAALFLRDSPELWRKVQEAVAAQDGARLAKAAHRLKGESSVFGAHRALALALQLEQMGKDNDLANAPQTLDQIEIELNRLRRELEAFCQPSAGRSYPNV